MKEENKMALPVTTATIEVTEKEIREAETAPIVVNPVQTGTAMRTAGTAETAGAAETAEQRQAPPVTSKRGVNEPCRTTPVVTILQNSGASLFDIEHALTAFIMDPKMKVKLAQFAEPNEVHAIRDCGTSFRLERSFCGGDSWARLLERTCQIVLRILPRFYADVDECQMLFEAELLAIIQEKRGKWNK